MKAKALLYCPKSNLFLFDNRAYKDYMEEKGITEPSFIITDDIRYGFTNALLNDSIVAKCEIKVEKIYYLSWMNESLRERILKQSCLTDEEFNVHMNGKDTCYALHLSNIEKLNAPLQKSCLFKDFTLLEQLKQAPQKLCDVYDTFGNRYILIPIEPERMVKILNGEQTVEVTNEIINSLKEW